MSDASGDGMNTQLVARGVALEDLDNDGHVDLYVTNYGANELWRNNGDGTFRNVTEKAGVGDSRWSVSASWVDYDRDGFLDLYVTRYVEYQPAKKCSGQAGRPDFCGPNAFRDVHDVVLRNETGSSGGEPRFADVSAAAGVEKTFAAGLGVVCLDADGDGVADYCDVCAGDDGAGDSDGDGVCDDRDVCPGFDDGTDSDGDGGSGR